MQGSEVCATFCRADSAIRADFKSQPHMQVYGTLTKLGVIIPTFNSASVLALTLEALSRQVLCPEVYEVTVVDDGSTDDTAKVIERMVLPYSLHYIYQSNAGAAAARNRGARTSSGDILIFLTPIDVGFRDCVYHDIKTIPR